jgi:hypothetical protein
MEPCYLRLLSDCQRSVKPRFIFLFAEPSPSLSHSWESRTSCLIFTNGSFLQGKPALSENKVQRKIWGHDEVNKQFGILNINPYWRWVISLTLQLNVEGPPLWSSGQSSWLRNGDVLCFLWGTNWIYTCYVEESRPPLWSSGQRSWLQNGDELCFLWGTNWIYVCHVEESRPLLWSSGQSSWLKIQRSGLDSRRYQISWEVVGLERGPLSLVSKIEELLGRKSSGSGLENRDYGRRGPAALITRYPSICKSWR